MILLLRCAVLFANIGPKCVCVCVCFVLCYDVVLCVRPADGRLLLASAHPSEADASEQASERTSSFLLHIDDDELQQEAHLNGGNA